MRKIRTFLYAGTALLTMSLVIFAASCKKNETAAAETTTSASDQAVTEKSFTDAQTISENAVSSSSMNYRTTAITASSCATVTTTTSGSNTITTINFGTNDCTCLDGRTRRGEIIVTYATGTWNNIGASRTITFNNYYQNDNQISGTKTVTYEGLNSANEPYFNVSINGTLTYPTGKTVTVSWTRVRTWISGFTLSGTTPEWSSDITYSISGTGSMTNSLGEAVTINIPAATPLIVVYGCKWIEAGTIDYILTSDGKQRSINYGTTAACDDMATVTLANGTTVSVTLP